MTLPITLNDPKILPACPPVCLACSEGDHEQIAITPCDCPCHCKVAVNV